MNNFDQNLRETQSFAGDIAQFAIVLLVVGFVVAIGAAIWVFKDAEARGKSGLAAALIVFLSAFYGVATVVMAVCAWILFRPERTYRGATGSRGWPEDLPSDIVAGPTTEEYLKSLHKE